MSRVLIVSRPALVHGFTPAGRSRRGDQPGRPDRPTGGAEEDDRPPVCPVCNKRLVILATHPGQAPDGRPIRRQLWGCPRGHATVYRVDGVFGPFDVLDDLNDE